MLRQAELEAFVEFCDYNQVIQTLLDPGSPFAGRQPGTNVVLMRWEDLGAADAIEANLTTVATAIRDSRRWHTRDLIVVTCPSSPRWLTDAEHASLAARCHQRLSEDLQGVSGVHWLTAEEVARHYPVVRYDDAEGERLGHVPFTAEYFAALGAMLARRLTALHRPPFKVIVLDCDNTLWRGVVGEDGPEGIHLDPGFEQLQRFVLAQRDAGMLVCLCSKNNPDDVWEAFRAHPEFPLQPQHILDSRINWAPKSLNIQELAATLSLGLDSFIFVDDNAKECAEMRAQCPEVLTLLLPETPGEIQRFLDHVWAFDHWSVTADDRHRATVYEQKLQRERLENSAPSFGAFIASLDLNVKIEPARAEHLPRVSQLTMRTNQFNCTTVRRSEAEIEAMIRDGAECLIVDVSDRFGSYGLVGAVLFGVEGETLAVDSFLLSCRALGRGVEHRVVNHLGQVAAQRELARVSIPFTPSAKNHPARAFLEGSGAPASGDGEGRSRFVFATQAAEALTYDPGASVPPPVAESVDRRSLAAASSPRTPCDYAAIALELSSCAQIVDRLASLRARTAPRSTGSSGHDIPRSDVERRLAAIWAETLELPAVGIRDSFFDLGGSSLLAVTLVSRVMRGFARENLTLSMVLQAPTVEDFARLLDAATLPNYQCLVPIRPEGARPPLYYVHGAGGNVLSLRPLAFLLPEDQPFYALQAKGLDGSEPFRSVRETAAQYVAEIRQFQPTGPYYVGGGCYGGIVAFEMAQILRAGGQTVGLLALVDSHNAAYGSMISKPYMLWCNARFMLQRAAHHGTRLAALPAAERRHYVGGRLHTMGRYALELLRLARGTTRSQIFNEVVPLQDTVRAARDPLVETLNRVTVANMRAQREYVPRLYDRDVALFNAEVRRIEPYQDRYHGWGVVTLAEHRREYTFPGDHDMREEANLRVLARQLDEALVEAQAKSGMAHVQIDTSSRPRPNSTSVAPRT